MEEKKRQRKTPVSGTASDNNMLFYNIEVPSGVVDEKKQVPKSSGRKLKNEKIFELPIGEAKEESEKISEEPLKNQSKESLERGNTTVKDRREAQTKTVRKKAPAKRLATKEAHREAERSRKKQRQTALMEIKTPRKSKGAVSPNRARNKAAAAPKNRYVEKFLEVLFPTNKDDIKEIIRKGIVIICIMVMIFSMGVLIKSTRLEKKVSKENAGDYFVNRYVYSYELYKNNSKEK